MDVHDVGAYFRAQQAAARSSRAWCSPSSPGSTSPTNNDQVVRECRGIGVRIEDDILVTPDGELEPHGRHPEDGERARASLRVTRARRSAPAARPADDRRAELVRRLAAWFMASRRDLPWRHTRDPYAIWVSEVMLQQTRVKTVLDYYPRFFARIRPSRSWPRPTWPRCSARGAGSDTTGGRARSTPALAKWWSNTAASLPRDAESLRKISGIGPYTAGAIASLAFGAQRGARRRKRGARSRADLRADLRRPEPARARGRYGTSRRSSSPRRSPDAYNEALMELGATVCLPGEPRCDACPVRELCEARARGSARQTAGSKEEEGPKRGRSGRRGVATRAPRAPRASQG